MGFVFSLILLTGALYGFALYVRDIVRAARRRNAGGDGRIWPPEVASVRSETPEGTPARPDR